MDGGSALPSGTAQPALPLAEALGRCNPDQRAPSPALAKEAVLYAARPNPPAQLIRATRSIVEPTGVWIHPPRLTLHYCSVCRSALLLRPKAKGPAYQDPGGAGGIGRYLRNPAISLDFPAYPGAVGGASLHCRISGLGTAHIGRPIGTVYFIVRRRPAIVLVLVPSCISQRI